MNHQERHVAKRQVERDLAAGKVTKDEADKKLAEIEAAKPASTAPKAGIAKGYKKTPPELVENKPKVDPVKSRTLRLTTKLERFEHRVQKLNLSIARADRIMGWFEKQKARYQAELKEKESLIPEMKKQLEGLGK